MYKTQQQQIRNLSKEDYQILRKMCFHSARLYNCALYLTRKQWEDTHTFLSFRLGYFEYKESENYKSLPALMAQQTCKMVERGFKSYLKLLALAKIGEYFNPINPPNFLPKNGYFCLVFPHADGGFRIRKGKIRISLGNSIKKETGKQYMTFNFPKNVDPNAKFKELRIHPHHKARYFTMEVVYEVKEKEKVEGDKILSIDIGLNNLATCFDGNRAFIISGRKLKSINYFYNKTIARLKSIREIQGYKHTTRQMFFLSRKRNRRIKDYMRKAAKTIMDYCLLNKVGTIVVGHNKGWKQNINLGKKNNQNFEQVPFGYLMQGLQSKCQEYGLQYKEVVESHTSKCSFLDCEEIKHHEQYKGQRIKRGLFRSANGTIVNADVNGAANIGRKVTGDYSLNSDQIMGLVSNPVRFNIA